MWALKSAERTIQKNRSLQYLSITRSENMMTHIRYGPTSINVYRRREYFNKSSSAENISMAFISFILLFCHDLREDLLRKPLSTTGKNRAT